MELDPEYADVLRQRFGTRSQVAVVEDDALRVPLPHVPFRAFGNTPFGLTPALLRRLLDDSTSSLVRADLIVQYEAARKRASVWPSHLASLGWLPWWEIRLARHLPALAFESVSPVDGGFLSIARRPRPLIDAWRRNEFLKLVRIGFLHSELPVSRSLRGRIPGRAWKRMTRERGIWTRATASDLDVFDWIALFALVHDRDDR